MPVAEKPYRAIRRSAATLQRDLCHQKGPVAASPVCKSEHMAPPIEDQQLAGCGVDGRSEDIGRRFLRCRAQSVAHAQPQPAVVMDLLRVNAVQRQHAAAPHKCRQLGDSVRVDKQQQAVGRRHDRASAGRGFQRPTENPIWRCAQVQGGRTVGQHEHLVAQGHGASCLAEGADNEGSAVDSVLAGHSIGRRQRR